MVRKIIRVPRPVLLDEAGSFEARHARHSNVHQNNFGPVCADFLDGVCGIVSFTYYFDVWIARQQVADTLTKQGVIVDD
jgi:hypothetical protein